MSNDTTVSTYSGVGFFGLLTVLFIGLKLTHYIDWSWWWVLSPIWLPIPLILIVLFVGWLFWICLKQILR